MHLAYLPRQSSQAPKVTNRFLLLDVCKNQISTLSLGISSIYSLSYELIFVLESSQSCDVGNELL